VVAIVLAALALVQRNTAVHEEHQAQSAALTNESLAQLPVDPQASVSLALSALKEASTPEAVLALRQAVSTDQLRRILPGDPGKIAFDGSGPQSIAFDPADPDLLATEGPEGVIRLWDAAKGSSLAWLNPSPKSSKLVIDKFIFNPTGSLIAAGYNDGTIRIWDVATRRLKVPVVTAKSAIVSLAFQPDTPHLFAVAFNGVIVSIDTRTGAVINRFMLIPKLEAGPDGIIQFGHGEVALAYSDGQVFLGIYGKGWITLKGYSGGLSALVFSPDDERLVGVSYSGIAQLWSAAGKHLATLSTEIPSNSINLDAFSAAFSTDDQLLAVGWGNGTVGVFNGRTGAVANVIHNGGNDFALGFDAHGHYLAVGSLDGSIKVWNVDTGALLSLLDAGSGPVFRLALNAPGDLLASASTDGRVRIWEPLPGELVGEIATSPKALAEVSQDGHQIAVTSSTDQVQIRLGTNGALVARHQFPQSPAGTFAAMLSPANSVVALPLATGTVLWNVRSGHVTDLADSAPQYGSYQSEYAFTPNGKFFVSSGPGGLVRAWSVTSGRVVATMPRRADEVTAIAVDSNSEEVAVADGNGDAYLWSMGEGGVSELPCDHPVSEVAFSPDGTLLVTATSEFTLQLWNVRSQRRLGQLATAGENVSFSPQGSLLAATSVTTGITLVRVGPGGFLGSPRVVGNTISLSPSFDSSGNVVMATNSNAVYLYDVDSGELLGSLGFGGSNVAFVPSRSEDRIVTLSSEGLRLYRCEACGAESTVARNASSFLR
jgi:WD40 repeat protein